MKQFSAITTHKYFPLSVGMLLYAGLWAFFFSHVKHYVDADGISYISIAEKYFHHNYKDAVNGFWSPMISWLIAVLLNLGFDKVFTAHLTGFFIGGFCLYSINLLAKHFSFTQKSKLLLNGFAAPLIMAYLYSSVAVDVLFLSLICCWLYFIFHPDFFSRWKYAAWAGVLGALSYFSKQYGFPYFIVFFPLFVISFSFFLSISFKEKIKIIAKRVAVGYLFFFLFALPWMLLISKKYEVGLIYGTTGKINFSQALNNEVRNINSKQGYFLYAPNPTAADYTEDVFYIQGKYVSIFDSKETLKNEWGLIKLSATNYVQAWVEGSYFSFCFLLLLLILFFQKSYFSEKRKLFGGLLLFLLTYPVGYLVIHVETRFMWCLHIVVLLFAMWCFQEVIFIYFKNKWLNCFLVAIVGATFLFTPIKILHSNFHRFEYIDKLSERLKREYNFKGKFFSGGGKAEDSQHLAFISNSEFVIRNPQYKNDTMDLREALLQNHINYYLYWHWNPAQTDTLGSFYNFKEITHGQVYGLQIFKVE